MNTLLCDANLEQPAVAKRQLELYRNQNSSTNSANYKTSPSTTVLGCCAAYLDHQERGPRSLEQSTRDASHIMLAGLPASVSRRHSLVSLTVKRLT